MKSQSDISKDTGLVQSAVSKLIIDLSNKGLIVCFNPEVRTNKLYGLTEYSAIVCSHVFHIDKEFEIF